MTQGKAFGQAQLLALAVAAGAAAVLLSLSAARGERVAVLALDAEEAEALCSKEGYPPADFWERARALGVGAAVVRRQPLRALTARGDVLSFTAEELEKWRAVGLISSGSALKAGSLWIRDRALEEAVLAAAAREGIGASTSSVPGYRVVEFDGPADPELGLYDPAVLRLLAAQGLPIVYAGPGPRAGAPVGLRWKADGGVEGQWGTGDLGPFDEVLEPRRWTAGSGLASLLLAVHGGPKRLVVARLGGLASVEAGFDSLREAVRELDRRGVPLTLPERPAPAAAPTGALGAALCRFLVWALGLLGPLLAARAGLLALKQARARTLASWPVAAPELPLAAGLLVQTAAAAGAGLAARAFGAFLPSGPGAAWSFWVLAGPIAAGAATLYTVDLSDWRRRLGQPFTPAALAKLAALAAAAVLLLEPRAALKQAGLLDWLQGLGDWPVMLWWWPLRWREMLIGIPCALQALFLLHWRLDCPDCATLAQGRFTDPRAWLLGGLLAPAGIVAALGRPGVTAGMGLEQTLWGLAVGGVIGGGGIALRLAFLPHESHGGKTVH